MPLPEFNADGRLPPGIYRGTPDEIANRFCRASERRRYLEGPLRLLVQIAIDSKAIALYLNGSFVTDTQNPRDIDAVIVLPDDFDTSGEFAQRLHQLQRDYGLDIERVAADDTEERDYLLNNF